MLPAAHRLRRSDQFRTVIRGRQGERRLPRGRAGGELMTVHLVLRPEDDSAQAFARVGFVVSKSVGNAVHRNRTQRRLRHVVAGQLAGLPDHADLVIRAHPGAALASSAQLDAELSRLLPRALRGATPASGRPA